MCAAAEHFLYIVPQTLTTQIARHFLASTQQFLFTFWHTQSLFCHLEKLLSIRAIDLTMDNLILNLNGIEEKYKKALDAIDEKYGPINSIEQQSLAYYEKVSVHSKWSEDFESLLGELNNKSDEIIEKYEAIAMNLQKVQENNDALDDMIEEQKLLHDDSGIETTLSIGDIRNKLAETRTDMGKIKRLQEELSVEFSVIVSCRREVKLHIDKLKRNCDALTSEIETFHRNVQGN